MKRRKMTEYDIRNASIALVSWLKSQDITDEEAVPVMAITMAAVLVNRFGDSEPAQAIVSDMIAKAVRGLNQRQEGQP